MAILRARALCFPSDDVGFARVVEHYLDDAPGSTAAQLQERLRLIAPNATVRARELSGEGEPTLYVYRDGRWTHDAQPGWWNRADAAKVTVSAATGAVTKASDAFLRLLGADGDWVVGRLYHEFVLPEARVASEVLHQVTLSTGRVHSIARVVAPDGRHVTCEFRAELHGDEIEVRVRRVTLAESMTPG